MYKVTTIKVNKRTLRFTSQTITFTCDSFNETKKEYEFIWGQGIYQWSHSINKSLIKSIEKL